MRQQLTRGFGVPVFNEYSAYEALHIGFDCTEGQLHIAEDRCYVELVDGADRPVPDGEEGHVVVSGFRERAKDVRVNRPDFCSACLAHVVDGGFDIFGGRSE